MRCTTRLLRNMGMYSWTAVQRCRCTVELLYRDVDVQLCVAQVRVTSKGNWKARNKFQVEL